MKIFSLVFSALVAVALSACGGDPLVGTWNESVASSALATGATSETKSLDLTSAKAFTLTDTTVYGASGGNFAGCTATLTVSGTYTDTATSYAATATAGSQAYSGCTAAGTDGTTDESAAIKTAGTISATYTISGSTLTVSTPAVAAIGAAASTDTYTKK